MLTHKGYRSKEHSVTSGNYKREVAAFVINCPLFFVGKICYDLLKCVEGKVRSLPCRRKRQAYLVMDISRLVSCVTCCPSDRLSINLHLLGAFSLNLLITADFYWVLPNV